MASYPIPPWLHGPPDPARILLESQRVGAEIAAQRARLQQQAQLEQIRLELEQEREDRQSRQRQQELEIQKSYDDQQVALKQQALDEAKKRIDSQVQAARQKYDAIQGYQKAVTPIEQGGLGMSQQDAILQFGPAMSGASGSTVSSMLRDVQMANRPEASLIDVPGGGKAIKQPSGTWTPWTRPEKEKIEADPKFSLTPSSIPGRPARIRGVSGVSPDQLQQFGITNKYNFKKPVSGKEDSADTESKGPIPLPKTEKELLEGQVYQTSKGLGMWDATQKKFKLVPQDQVTPLTPTEETPPEDPEHPSDEE